MADYDHYGGTPPHSDNDTSLAAAESIKQHVSRLASDVLTYIHGRGDLGATCWEVEEALGMSHQTASARMRELALANLIVKTKHKRRTGSGRMAAVWAVPLVQQTLFV